MKKIKNILSIVLSFVLLLVSFSVLPATALESEAKHHSINYDTCLLSDAVSATNITYWYVDKDGIEHSGLPIMPYIFPCFARYPSAGFYDVIVYVMYLRQMEPVK